MGSPIMKERIEVLRELTELQCRDGNWNYDPYMYGMANGMIFALTIMDGKERAFLEAPKEWLRDKKEIHQAVRDEEAGYEV